MAAQRDEGDDFDQRDWDEVLDAEFERKPSASRALVPTFEQPLAHSDYWVRKPVPIERDLNNVARRLLEEANLAGEEMYYAWGKGENRVEGGSIILAMSMARCWGNCVVEQRPMQETHDAYIFTARFIDLETGTTYDRQFRQSKRWTVHGKFDASRKEDIRFQIGQSKAARNVILRSLPEYLKNKAIAKAKEGVRVKLEALIKDKGIAFAQDIIIGALEKEGVPLERILDYCGVADVNGLDIDKIVELRGNLAAIQNGEDHADNIFPPTEAEAAAKKPVDPVVQSDLTETVAALAGKSRRPATGSKPAAAPQKTPEPTVTTPQPEKPNRRRPPTSGTVAAPTKLELLAEHLAKAKTADELEAMWKKFFEYHQIPESDQDAAEEIYDKNFDRIDGIGEVSNQEVEPEKPNPVVETPPPPTGEVSDKAKEYVLQFANSKTAGGVNKILERAEKPEAAFSAADIAFIRQKHAERVRQMQQQNGE